MKHRVAEVRAVTAVLEKPAEDLDSVVQDVLDAVTETKWGRDVWVTVVRHRSGNPETADLILGYGPYATKNEAKRDLGRRIPELGANTTVLFVPIRNMDSIADPGEGLFDA